MSTKVDLHSHTQESDGSLSVEELINRAIEHDVGLLAITDHDTVAAHAYVDKYIQGQPIKVIPAVEISAAAENHELHIVGLGIDPKHQGLQQLLKSNRDARQIRATKILQRLKKSGLDDLTEQLNELVPSEVVCRSHLAQLLCEQGVVKNFQKAFKKYLGRSGKAWVSIKWQPMADVIACIKNAGGTAVLAHPSKYKLSNIRLELVIDEFVKAGGEAIEIAYPGLNPAQRALLIRQVDKHQLQVSQGSDFHHPGTSWTELGAFGVNPKTYRTVWQQFSNSPV